MNEVAHYRWILMDLDGCGANTWPQTLRVFEIIAEVLGVELAESRLLELCGKGEIFIECCKELFPGHDPEEFYSSINQHRPRFDKAYELIKPFPGVSEALNDLRNNHSVQVAITTNRYQTENLEAVLSRAKLKVGDNIDVVVALAGDIRPKPAPDLFQEAMKKLKVPKGSRSLSRCLIVEDGLYGLRVANYLSIPTCAVLWGAGTEKQLESCNPTHLIAKPKQLISVVTKGRTT